MNAYSPFTKELKDLEATDLQALKEATEGWYIEYKREIPNALAVAKSVSAFSNTYGGWLFYGIAEKSKEEAVAGSFPGIPRSEIDAGLQRIRQAIATLINPSPHFDTKVVWGRCEELALEADHAVICIHMPWSPTAPHVHRSGQIYRRVSDGSEPKPENDRHLLDQLWQRSKGIRKKYKKWISRDPEFSKGEKDAPFVRLMLVADLWRERDAWTNAPIEKIRQILGQENGIVSAIPFDTVYSFADGFIGRQTRGNDPHRMGLTWRFSPNLSSDVLVPLNFHATANPFDLLPEFEGYDSAHRYVEHLQAIGYKSPRVVDLNLLFNVVVAIVETYQRILDTANWNHGFFIKARLLNVWRTVPFLDVPIVLDEFERHGLPMVMNETVTIPPDSAPESFVFIDPRTDIGSEAVRIFLRAIAAFEPIARGFGIPGWIDTGDEDRPYSQELLDAGNRAKEVQTLRIARHRRDGM